MQGPLAVDVRSPVDNALSSVGAFLPKFLAFVVILAIGWLVAWLLQRGVRALLTKLRFERVVERGGLAKAFSGGSWTATTFVAKLVYYAVLLVALTMAFGVFGPNPISNLLSAVVSFLPKAFVAIVIVVVAGLIGRAVRDLVGGALGGLSYGKLLGNLAGGFIVALGVIAALNQVGVATAVTGPVLIAVLATVAGILIVGVGGGLVKPMQGRWERMLDVAEQESRNIAEHTARHQEAKRAAEEQTQSLQQPGHAGDQVSSPYGTQTPSGYSAQSQPAYTGAQPAGYPTPSQQPGYAAPQQPGYGAPPQQPGYGAPPQQPGYGSSSEQPGSGQPPQQG
ncbi:MAG TPA: hypothetical protein VGR21_03805 [Cryptosporangiaceae bacterium]|nr:hypothetical protein [Cryptosporangiaceae bacterium]